MPEVEELQALVSVTAFNEEVSAAVNNVHHIVFFYVFLGLTLLHFSHCAFNALGFGGKGKVKSAADQTSSQEVGSPVRGDQSRLSKALEGYRDE